MTPRDRWCWLLALHVAAEQCEARQPAAVPLDDVRRELEELGCSPGEAADAADGLVIAGPFEVSGFRENPLRRAIVLYDVWAEGFRHPGPPP